MNFIADPIRAKSNAGAAEHNAKARKYHLRAGDMYLHWSGQLLTSKRWQAWSGTAEQARNCRAKFDVAAGCRRHRIISPAIPSHTEGAEQ